MIKKTFSYSQIRITSYRLNHWIDVKRQNGGNIEVTSINLQITD